MIALSAALAGAAGAYSVNHFKINTDISRMISTELPWRQREIALRTAFTQGNDMVLAVVDAPTSEAATRASTMLVSALAARPDIFHTVRAVSETDFFARNALLYLPTAQVASTVNQLQQAAPIVQIMTSDPSLRGLSRALSAGVMGAGSGEGPGLDALAPVMRRASTALEGVLAGKPTHFSWRELVSGKPAETTDLRRFIEIHPVLDYAALQPGKEATDVIRQSVDKLDLQERLGAGVRLTGPVPIADEEFATIEEGALVNGIATVAIVLFILWLALRSARIILAVFITVAIGLAMTAAVGLMLVEALNLISVAFAVLFVGIGVDFGIQFSVRYRAERHTIADLPKALASAGEHIAVPLALAAAATAAGFLSFVPTDYRGISELGQIAGLGMIIAFVTSITVLPALIKVLKPRGEKEPLGYAALAPVDRFMERHRMPILIGTAALIVAGLPLLYFLKFDFNPINLRNPQAESIATYLDVRNDPVVGANAVDVVADSQRSAAAVAQRLRAVPEVSSVRTLASFVPAEQERKLALVTRAEGTLTPALEGSRRPAPTDAENVGALRSTQALLERAAGNRDGAGPLEARRLAGNLDRLADATEAARERARSVFVPPLMTALTGLRQALHPESVTEHSLPGVVRQQWLTGDGRARVQVLPKGDPNDDETIRAFARAVQAVEPAAAGGPIAIVESGRTIIRAFIEAGLWALVSIAILLWLTLRRIGDVLLTLIPLVVSGVLTLELCVLLGLSLNFANIIALPLLLGIGVAFKIYYMISWRAGYGQVLQSPLTRAVFFSALTTATAFGSLWLSSHPGTSSMGKLLALSLVCTLAGAVLFQPVLMGPPRRSADARADALGRGSRSRRSLRRSGARPVFAAAKKA